MISFLMNPTSWRDGAPVPGGMADALVQPILPHLGTDYTMTNAPQARSVNVFYSHRAKYQRMARSGTAVFISHGIADKNWRQPVRMRNQWDWIFVSGPAWTKRYAESSRIDMRTVVEAGYAKLDPIFRDEIPAPQRDGRVRVVYAPTHGGGGETTHTDGDASKSAARLSSHHHRGDVLAMLPESEFDVVVALHPRHRDDGRSTLAEYVGADVVIADGGSTIYEAWALDIPVVFPSWLVGNRHASRSTLEGDIYKSRIGWHVDRPEDLARTVEAAARSGITDRECDFVEPIFPRAYRGRSGRMHAEALDDIASGVAVRHLAPLDLRQWRTELGETVVEVIRGSIHDRQFERNPKWQEVAT